eukprot:PITA_01854
MAEGLGRSIKSTQQSQLLRGLSLHNSSAFTHQQFVDDNMLFGHPSVQEDLQLKYLLSNFSDTSGASINKSKSQNFFFHTLATTQAAIARTLGFSIAVLPSKYLGAPLTVSALKHSSWNILLEKLEAHLSSWTHRALNMASCLVLIKVVPHSMSLYLFSILVAPKWVLKEIKNLQRSFFWGSTGHNRKWALVKRDTVCLPKSAEDTQTLDSVKNFWNPSSSQGHRQWIKADQILRQGSLQLQLTRDSELMKRRIQLSNERDILRWGYEETGTFTTKEAYNIIIKEHMVKDPLWSKVRDPSNWPKISTFLWLLCHNKILTWDNLRKRNYHGPSIYPIYRQAEESVKHLMHSCHVAHKLWGKVSF